MKINGLAFVAIPVTDMQRACAFYENVLRLKVSGEMMDGKWVEYSLGNNTLAIANVGPEWVPSDQGTGAALEVEDFEENINYVKDRKVPFTTKSLESQCCHMNIIRHLDDNNIVIRNLKLDNKKNP